MKYTILGFSQRKAVELELDLKHLMILRWFVDFKDSGAMAHRILEDDKYYWVKYDALINDLPILKTSSKDTIYKYMKKLSKAGVLKHKTVKQNGVWSFFTLGDTYKELIDDDYEVGNKSEGFGKKSEGVGFISEGVGFKSERNGQKDGTNNTSINNTSINNPSINTTTKEEVVVEDVNRYRAILEIKKAFNEMCDKDIKKVADSLQSTTGYNIEYLREKLEITKNNSQVNNITGFLIKAIKENYNIKSLSNDKQQHTTKPTKFHNFEQTFEQYSDDEFEDIVEKSQRAKFGS